MTASSAQRGRAAAVRLVLILFLTLSALTAAWLPRFAAAAGRASMPTVLTDADASAYRQVFRLQEQGRWREADQRRRAISDRVLLGHVLYQRYMAPQYRTRYAELRAC